MKNTTNKIVFYLACALFAFLPFSSWLVSLSGNSSVSLIRDLLIILIFTFCLINGLKLRFKSPVVLALLFLVWGIASIFWREASFLQWAKGLRFTFLPIILFLALSNISFSEAQKKVLYKIIFIGGILISLLALLQLLRINIPLQGNYSGEGALESIHYVGNSTLLRLQSVLAGPNALGLYMLSICAYTLGVFKKINYKTSYLLIIFASILVLSFSRSAIIGLAVGMICALFLFLSNRYGRYKSVVITGFLTLLILVAGIFAINIKSKQVKNFITHGDSSSLRFDQYKRIWNSRFEIGLVGRGSGTAGPASQYRLDGGENHWTENIYLDIYEELGLVGFLLYLLLLASLVISVRSISDKDERNTYIILIASYAVAGIFINYYTGQVGIFLLWLILALSYQPKNDKRIIC
jgi:O-antigen ligase